MFVVHTFVELFVSGTSYEVSSELPGPRLTMEQFLQKLPNNVVHGGKVIGIRSSLKDHFTGSSKHSSSTEIVETKAVQEMQERLVGNSMFSTFYFFLRHFCIGEMKPASCWVQRQFQVLTLLWYHEKNHVVSTLGSI